MILMCTSMRNRSVRDCVIHASNFDCHHETETTIQLTGIPVSNDPNMNLEHAFHHKSSHKTCVVGAEFHEIDQILIKFTACILCCVPSSSSIRIIGIRPKGHGPSFLRLAIVQANKQLHLSTSWRH
jgi:hypothetical protein